MSAAVRTCDRCGVVTAIDLDPTELHLAELRVAGQTIRLVSREEAITAFHRGGKCRCTNREQTPHYQWSAAEREISHLRSVVADARAHIQALSEQLRGKFRDCERLSADNERIREERDRLRAENEQRQREDAQLVEDAG